MKKEQFITIYQSRYFYIESRIKELSDYVAIEKNNYGTYSNVICSVFLEICGEVDSIADELCAALGKGEKERYGITNKINIIVDTYPNLKSWRCTTKFPYETIDLVPFAKFTDTVTSDWWKAYNDVKHRRTAKNENNKYKYESANLKNVLHALAAMYLLIIKLRTEYFKDAPGDLCSDIFDVTVI